MFGDLIFYIFTHLPWNKPIELRRHRGYNFNSTVKRAGLFEQFVTNNK